MSRTFYVLDFDRTLGSLTASTSLLLHVLSSYESDAFVYQVKEQLQVSSDAGRSLDMNELLESTLPPNVVKTVLDEFVKTGLENANLCEPGVSKFLNWLQLEHLHFGIVSYGSHKWQLAKIQAAGLGHIPSYIIPTPQKAEVIAGWQTSDGTKFNIPRELTGAGMLTVDTVILVDDKAIAFDGLNSKARGYLVLPSSPLLSQRGDIPQNVQRVLRIDDIIMHESYRKKSID